MSFGMKITLVRLFLSRRSFQRISIEWTMIQQCFSSIDDISPILHFTICWVQIQNLMQWFHCIAFGTEVSEQKSIVSAKWWYEEIPRFSLSQCIQKGNCKFVLTSGRNFISIIGNVVLWMRWFDKLIEYNINLSEAEFRKEQSLYSHTQIFTYT